VCKLEQLKLRCKYNICLCLFLCLCQCLGLCICPLYLSAGKVCVSGQSGYTCVFCLFVCWFACSLERIRSASRSALQKSPHDHYPEQGTCGKTARGDAKSGPVTGELPWPVSPRGAFHRCTSREGTGCALGRPVGATLLRGNRSTPMPTEMIEPPRWGGVGWGGKGGVCVWGYGWGGGGGHGGDGGGEGPVQAAKQPGHCKPNLA